MEATPLNHLGTRHKFDVVDVLAPDQIQPTVSDVLTATQCIDVHTHLYPPAFGQLGLWGIADC